MQLSNSDYMYAASQLSSIASSSTRSSSTLNSIRSQISTAIEEMEDNTAAIIEVQRMLGGVLDELKDMHFTIYTQNNITNSLLQSIDETLKTPSQTAAREQFTLATGLMEKHSYDRAKSYLEKAIDLDPLVYAYYTNLSICNYKIGNHRDAGICAKESLLYTDNNLELEAYSRYLLALALYDLGQVENAVNELDKASKLSKKPAPYFYYAAIFYIKHKDYRVQVFNRFLIKSFLEDPSFICIAIYEKAFEDMRYEVNDMINEFKLMVTEELEEIASSIKSSPLPTYNFEVPKNCITRPEKFYWHAYRESLNRKDDLEWTRYRYSGQFPTMLSDNVHLTYENFITVVRDATIYEFEKWGDFSKNVLNTIESQDLESIIKMNENVSRFRIYHKEWFTTMKQYTERFIARANQYIQHIHDEYNYYDHQLYLVQWDLNSFSEHRKKPGIFAKRDEKEAYEKELKKLKSAFEEPQSFMDYLKHELSAAENQLAVASKFQQSFNSQSFPVVK